MNIKLALFLAVSILFCSTVASAQALIIAPVKRLYSRNASSSDYKKTFEVTISSVRSKLPSALRKRIAANIDPWRAFSSPEVRFSLRDAIDGTDGWVDKISYDLNYNAHNILDLTLRMDGSGAYPDTSLRHVVLDTKSGRKLAIADLFKQNRLRSLRDAVRLQMRSVESGLNDEEKEQLIFQRGQDVYNEYNPSPKNLELKNLDGFSISGKGVTFIYDYAYAHAVEALEPSGEYFLSFTQLKPFIKREGLLGRFIR